MAKVGAITTEAIKIETISHPIDRAAMHDDKIKSHE